jgi:hypothetical protein
MRLYNIVSGIILILPIIDFAVTAPVLVQEKRQARVDVVHIPGDAMTMLGKRGGDSGELFELWVELFDHPESHFPTKPEELPAARPSLSSQPSGPAGGSTDVEQPLPPIHEEPVAVSSQVHAPPSLGDEWNKMWRNRNLIQGHFPAKPEESSAARPSLSSLQSGPAGGSMDVEQPLPPIHEKPVPLSSQVHAPPSLGDEWNKMWRNRNLVQGHFPAKPEESSSARPSLSSLQSGPAGGSMDVEQPLLPIHGEPVPMFSQVHAPPSLGDEWNKMWRNRIQGHFPAKPEESSAARPSSSSLPSGPAHGWTDVERPLPSVPKGPSQVPSPDRAPLSPDDETDKLWVEFFGHPENQFLPKLEELPATHPSSNSQLLGPPMGGRT